MYVVKYSWDCVAIRITYRDNIMISIKSNPDYDLGIIAYEASKNALKKFKGKHCKIGRARMFVEKSKELDDPGMYALCVLSSIFKK